MIRSSKIVVVRLERIKFHHVAAKTLPALPSLLAQGPGSVPGSLGVHVVLSGLRKLRVKHRRVLRSGGPQGK